MAWYEKVEETNTIWQELQNDEGLTYFFNTETKETSWEKPEELLTDEEREKQGEWIWLPDEIECYIPAKVTVKTDSFITVETEYGSQEKIPTSNPIDPLKWSSLQRITPDLVLLDTMSIPLILHNLKKRFVSGDIYTNIGTICISINPYTYLDPPIYGVDVINKYRMKLSEHKQMPPHVFCIGDNAFKGLTFKNGLNQSVIISGESGAGKTEAAKQVVNYISAVSGSISGVENYLFVSNPILESFGNAKTIRNNNSSRFGKYMEMYFNTDLKLCGAFITNYLLEKIRVPSPMENERNYHIFYQLCLGGNEFTTEFNLSDPNSFVYLSKGNCVEVSGIDDSKDFYETKQAMEEMKFSANEIHDIFQTVAAILHLGNVTTAGSGEGVEITNPDALSNAAYYLGVTDEMLNYRLTYRKIKIHGQAAIDVPLKPVEAIDARDACSKFIYSNLFNWIVAKINITLSIDKTKYKSIGILDIFGFEIFEHNSFEQMCINYTNEQLQQNFNYNVFKLEEDLYKRERIQVEHVPFIDNEGIINLIEDRIHGILNLLDEECKLPKGSEEKFLQKLNDAQKTCKNFEPGKGYSKSFTIIHYAGPVSYNTNNFMEKNRDTLTLDLLEMVSTSSFTFLASLFTKQGNNKNDKSRKETLGKQFKRQLQVLMKTVNSTQPHYIRCIKPNEDKAPLTFVSKNCKEQLTYAGVFEAVQIRKAGYPFHLTHKNFVERYGMLADVTSGHSGSSGCNKIIAFLGLNPENIKIGSTMVLYRAEEHRLLELKRSIVVEQKELNGQLKKICEIDPNSRANPETYYEELAILVRKANRFKLETAVANTARERLEFFIESRIDPQTKQMLQNAFDTCNFDELTRAVEIADQNNYQTKLCKDCRKLLKHITRIREELNIALDNIERKGLEACVSSADNCYYNDPNIEQAKHLLGLPKIDFLKEQIKVAAKKKQINRQIRLEISLKDIVMEKSMDMFKIESFDKLKTAANWANEKLIGRSKLKLSFLNWQKESIHSPLINYPSLKTYKAQKKYIPEQFKKIQVYMGDRKPSKKQAFNKKVGIEIVLCCLKDMKIRNEFFIHIIKQLSNNPNQGSRKKGWDLMILGINTFPPGQDFSNYLYAYLKKNSPVADKDRFLIALQTINLMNTSELKAPNGNDYDSIISGQNILQPQFTDKTPPGAPSWEDLLMSWDEREEDDDIMFTASTHNRGNTPIKAFTPKNTTTNAPVEPTEKVIGWGAEKNVENAQVEENVYEGTWTEHIDPESGCPYYYNEETCESVWEKPDEMK